MEAFVGPERVFWPMLLGQLREDSQAVHREGGVPYKDGTALREDGGSLRVAIRGTGPECVVGHAPFLARLTSAEATAGPVCVVDTKAIDIERELFTGCSLASFDWVVFVLPPDTSDMAAVLARVACIALAADAPRVIVHVPVCGRLDIDDRSPLFFYCRHVFEIGPAEGRGAGCVVVSVEPPGSWREAQRRTLVCGFSVDAEGVCVQLP